MKKCNKCKTDKELNEFHNNKRFEDGKHNVCKICKKAVAKKYYENNKEEVKERVNDYYENNKEICNGRIKNYYEKNRDELISYKQNWYEKNKEEANRKSKEYYENNKNEINSVKKKYIYNKRKTDKLFVLKERISGLIYQSIKNQGYKKSERTEKILGCTIIEFREYLESKFIDDMSWDNQGEWHLDHKRPVSWGKTEDEVIELNHYTNFQPLWESDNLSKGNRWED